MTVEEKRRRFQELHAKGYFILPNPWDIGSARYLKHLGARALATTSAGFAFSRGLADGAVTLDAMVAHIAELAAATELPLNADFEHGYADDLKGLKANVRRVVETGVAGLSLEDSTGKKARPLFDLTEAAERIAAARAAISDERVILVGRAECFLVGKEDIEETIRRLQAYSAAGADCLYAPGVSKREHVRDIVAAVAPKPVNLLMSGPKGISSEEAAELGVRRISVGGGLARAAWGGFTRAAEELMRHGSFAGFSGATPHGELQEFFQRENLSR